MRGKRIRGTFFRRCGYGRLIPCTSLVLACSFIAIIVSALYWYWSLYQYIIWEDEGNTYFAVSNFLLEGFPPRKGLLADSQYFDHNFNVGSYWQYTAEIVLRAPLQLISRFFDDPTIQTFTPLFLTLIIVVYVWYNRGNFGYRERQLMVVGNFILCLSGFLMSSYHYVRYYWFVIASTYICILVVAARLFVVHSLRQAVVTIMIASVPFFFHETGGMLLIVTVFLEGIYFAKVTNFRIKKLNLPIVLLTLLVILGLSYYIIPRIAYLLESHNLSIGYNPYGCIRYLKRIFFLNDWSNSCLGFISLFAGAHFIWTKKNNFCVCVGRICLVFFSAHVLCFLLFGYFLRSPRYNLPSHTVFVAFLSAFVVDFGRRILYSSSMNKMLMYYKNRYLLSVFVTLAVCFFLFPWFNYRPSWGILHATRLDLDTAKTLLSNFGNKRIVFIANNFELLAYFGDYIKLFKFRSESHKLNVSNCYTDHGLYYEQGFRVPFFGSERSIAGCLNSLSDNDILYFMGVKPACDVVLKPFFQKLGVFDHAVAISKKDFEIQFRDYKAHSAKSELQPSQISEWKRQALSILADRFRREGARGDKAAQKREEHLKGVIGELQAQLSWLKKKFPGLASLRDDPF